MYWLSLGGKSLGYGLSPFESQWESHLESHSIRWRWPSHCEPGDIQAAFENQPHSGFGQGMEIAQ